MGFTTAVRTCLSKYVTFSGRARRSEFWYFALFTFLVGIVSSALDHALGTDEFNEGNGVVGTVTGLALLLPSLAAAARRLHDIGRSGWWQALVYASLPLLFLAPAVGLILFLVSVVLLIVWFCTDSRPDNQYGPNPKAPASPYGDGYGGYGGAYPPPPPYGG
ncbi:uncharacterized membrane protein YhaH (DUF805 family) [Nocardioides cavernae]|uniref:Uncharacterized membrane protein YhaH (DUF805 family) n=1 Tax=Nocardioides cavernae TaxID=1921566 RepID=A0A7Y9H5V7_9ACTN|nr:DUF805 domain-containing protein [Nocardioides cavernae]NYE38268.1 uncharacterized membrane protein YhaH (DUF805 family) [Nocardioides cavernae]